MKPLLTTQAASMSYDPDDPRCYWQENLLLNEVDPTVGVRPGSELQRDGGVLVVARGAFTSEMERRHGCAFLERRFASGRAAAEPSRFSQWGSHHGRTQACSSARAIL